MPSERERSPFVARSSHEYSWASQNGCMAKKAYEHDLDLPLSILPTQKPALKWAFNSLKRDREIVLKAIAAHTESSAWTDEFLRNG